MIQHRYAPYIQFIALLSIGAGLSTSVFLMSIGGIAFAISWLLFPDLKKRILTALNNRYFQLSLILFLLHLAGLLWSSDMKYAFNDIRIKIPLVLFPFLFLSTPALPEKRFRLLLLLIILATLISTLISFGIYLGWFPVSQDISEIRYISPFVSHIRLSLVVVVSIILLWWTWYKYAAIPLIAVIALSCWFIFFLYLLESATGILILTATLFMFGVMVLLRSDKKLLRFGIPTLFTLLLVFVGIAVFNHIRELRQPKEQRSEFSSYTQSGCFYIHDPNNSMLENGYYTWSHVCLEELESTWNSRSAIPIHGLDKKGQAIFGTVVRYITSKGLKKDKEGVEALSETDIRNIENGIANVNYLTKNGLHRRIEEIIFEIDSYFSDGYYTGNSVTQRLEFWKAGWQILMRNPLIGVGTGDPQQAYNEQYAMNQSPLEGDRRLRSHNQFLAMGVAFGFTGLVLFMVFAVYPLIAGWKKKNYLFLFFYFGALLSFLTEDTLETQAGVSYFCYFTGLLFLMPSEPISQSER